MIVADSVTSFKQVAGDPLTPGSVPYPERDVTGRRRRRWWWWWWLAHGWRPPRCGERAQRDTAPKVIVINFARRDSELGKMLMTSSKLSNLAHQWKAGSMAHSAVLPSNYAGAEWTDPLIPGSVPGPLRGVTR